MRNSYVLLIVLALVASCSSRGKKHVFINNSSKYITVVNDVGGLCVAYTGDGHTIINIKDSVSNYIVYYLKFDDIAEKYGQDWNNDQIVRVEMDSSLNVLKSIISVYGGAFCQKNYDIGYNAYYFDENIKGNGIERIDVPSDYEKDNNNGNYHKIKKIIALLKDACVIARTINEHNAGGWHNIASALEPCQEIMEYDVLVQDTIYNPAICERISKIEKVSVRLSHYYFMLQEKMINVNNND